MTLDSIEVIYYTCIFLLPGYFISGIVEAFTPSKQITDGVRLLRYLGYSIFNFAVWSWAFWAINVVFDSKRVVFWIFMVLMMILSSLITGGLIGIFNKEQILRKVMAKLHFQVEHTIPTAWDYKFSELKNYRWVIVRLSGGDYVCGKYDTNSFASSDAENHDLYLEETYLYQEGQPWKVIRGNDGIWISASEVKSIEFFASNTSEFFNTMEQNGYQPISNEKPHEIPPTVSTSIQKLPVHSEKH